MTGLSLVFVAAEAGSEVVCRLLLSKFRLSADLPADNGFTPVFTAAQFGQNKTLAVLAEHGADFKRNYFYKNIFFLQQETNTSHFYVIFLTFFWLFFFKYEEKSGSKIESKKCGNLILGFPN